MKTLTFLLSTVIELYTMALLLRVWMQWARFLQSILTIYRENHAAHCGAASPHHSGNGAD